MPECQNARKCAVQVQLRLHALAARGHRRDHDLVDQATDRLTSITVTVRLWQYFLTLLAVCSNP